MEKKITDVDVIEQLSADDHIFVNKGGALRQITVEKLSEEIANLSLDKHTDGLVYIFVNGKPVGNGLNISGGTVGDSDNITFSDGVLTILSLANEPTLKDGVLSIT